MNFRLSIGSDGKGGRSVIKSPLNDKATDTEGKPMDKNVSKLLINAEKDEEITMIGKPSQFDILIEDEEQPHTVAV